MFSLSLSLHQWRIQNKRLGGQSNTVFVSLNIQGCLPQLLGITQKWLLVTLCRTGKWLFLLIRLCDFSKTNHIWKSFTTTWELNPTHEAEAIFISKDILPINEKLINLEKLVDLVEHNIFQNNHITLRCLALELLCNSLSGFLNSDKKFWKPCPKAHCALEYGTVLATCRSWKDNVWNVFITSLALLVFIKIDLITAWQIHVRPKSILS